MKKFDSGQVIFAEKEIKPENSCIWIPNKVTTPDATVNHYAKHTVIQYYTFNKQLVFRKHTLHGIRILNLGYKSKLLES